MSMVLWMARQVVMLNDFKNITCNIGQARMKYPIKARRPKPTWEFYENWDYYTDLSKGLASQHILLSQKCFLKTKIKNNYE